MLINRSAGHEQNLHGSVVVLGLSRLFLNPSINQFSGIGYFGIVIAQTIRHLIGKSARLTILSLVI